MKKFLASAVFFVAFVLVALGAAQISPASAQCNEDTARLVEDGDVIRDGCGVCDDPNDTCVSATGGMQNPYQCRHIEGQCGATADNDCSRDFLDSNPTDEERRAVCPPFQICEEGQAGSVACRPDTPECNESTLGQGHAEGVCPEGTTCQENVGGNSYSCRATNSGDQIETVPFSLCSQVEDDPGAYAECLACTGGSAEDEDYQGVWTAIGCINRDPTIILTTLLRVGLSIGGGIGLLMILGAGFIFSTSSGDPKRVDQAKELVTSAVVGLIFIIFSVAILQFIGFTVLRIPGFGG